MFNKKLKQENKKLKKALFKKIHELYFIKNKIKSCEPIYDISELMSIAVDYFGFDTIDKLLEADDQLIVFSFKTQVCLEYNGKAVVFDNEEPNPLFEAFKQFLGE